MVCATKPLGEAILANGRVEAGAACAAFDAWMRAKPVDIGNTVRRNLVACRNSGQPVAQPSEHDAGNGAAMRVLPVALACLGQPADAVRAASRAQAHVTHHNAVSDAACETLVLAVQDFIGGATADAVEQSHISALVRDFPVFAWDRKRQENPSGYVVDTLQAVFQSLFATESFEDCLIDIVNRGGDADTTGAIAGMLAGARYGLDAIPRRWLNNLETMTRVRCEKQAEALVALADAAPGGAAV